MRFSTAPAPDCLVWPEGGYCSAAQKVVMCTRCQLWEWWHHNAASNPLGVRWCFERFCRGRGIRFRGFISLTHVFYRLLSILLFELFHFRVCATDLLNQPHRKKTQFHQPQWQNHVLFNNNHNFAKSLHALCRECSLFLNGWGHNQAWNAI